MTIQRLEHIGIVVDDLAAATAFFAALGLELEGEASVEGASVDRINGLEGVRADIVMLRTPDGNGKVALAKYRSPSYEGADGPAPANAPGIRHILFVVDDIEASLAGLRAHGGELVGDQLGEGTGRPQPGIDALRRRVTFERKQDLIGRELEVPTLLVMGEASSLRAS
ncbi:MAG: VOC family protein [Actinobacteria bacterium]|nr:VOC family protein [Actinomycetota bacterium]